MHDPVEQFRAALSRRGIILPGEIIADGRIHRCDAEGKNGRGDAAYLLHLNGVPAGGFQNWRDGEGWEDWRADIGRPLTASEKASQRAKTEATRREHEAEEAHRRTEARERAAAILNAAHPATADHPYLRAKGVRAHGLQLYKGALVIPMRDSSGELHSLQFIGADGTKRFLTGGRKQGCYFAIGKPQGVLCIAEGYATGASLFEATGYAVAVAFDADNLEPVAQDLQAKFPELRPILCADDDAASSGNPGITKAMAAARAVGGLMAVPDFGPDRPEGATDFNDLALHRGAEAVRKAIEAARTPEYESAPAGATASLKWPEPQPLTAKLEAHPYPIDALPGIVRAAVEEVQAFTKAPIGLVAPSALCALSLAVQAHADVKRAERLDGPTSLFLLTIADSGERKTTCDGYFSAAIRDYESEQAEAAKPEQAKRRAGLEAWEAKREGIKAQIRKQAADGDVAGLEASLANLERDRPEPLRVPRIIYSDVTSEKLTANLATVWPSGGVVSSEAGIVFGAHSMNPEKMMLNLATLNVLWDGGALRSDRKSVESHFVRRARLTVALQVQEVTLRAFFDKSKGLARGSGFLARFLVAWPESTQGFRPFTEPSASWPALAAFNRRIAELLNVPPRIEADGSLLSAMLTFAPDAREAWVAFHDAIEAELRSGGELADVRDVASKTADNAARLSALFHVLDHGTQGAIGAAHFGGASRIAAWHLNEARRFFGELALPADLGNAARLDSWLIDYCRRKRTHHVPRRTVQQFGPPGLREKGAIEAATRELEELDRAKLSQDGRRKLIQVNPALLTGGEA